MAAASSLGSSKASWRCTKATSSKQRFFPRPTFAAIGHGSRPSWEGIVPTLEPPPLCLQAHGHGCRRYGSGATYEGLYDGDRRVGHGVYTWPCGHQFVGEWQARTLPSLFPLSKHSTRQRCRWGAGRGVSFAPMDENSSRFGKVKSFAVPTTLATTVCLIVCTTTEEKMQESALHAPDQVLVVSLQQRS
jgi:hypothetical protein